MSTNLAIKADILECSSNVNSVTSSPLQSLFKISMQAFCRVTECEDRIRHLEVYLENRNIIIPPSPNNVPDHPGFDVLFTGLDTGVPLIASRMPRTQGSPIVNANSNTRTNATTINVHPSNDIDGNDGNSRGDSTTQLPVDHVTDVKGQSIPVRVTNRSRDTSDGDSWCEDEFKLVENRRVERYCLIGLRLTVNTRLLTTEVEDQGPKVKAIRVFPIRGIRDGR
ncbi:hypothetical protein DPMN_069056 [Dreissena polymorpha]|uniref:Uncharacterized protein n=1 Tax=Dreissena polymorpha TaxID=45954 RepID=A0A9D4BUP7_DREPO|nr:hypothetical protein DPMN_069056 [Dreissena polymorpha]